MMNILIVRNYPTYINLENESYNIQEIGLAKALITKGHNVDILFYTNKNEMTKYISYNNKKICIFYRKGLAVLKNLIYTNVEKLFDNYDIIQCCEYNQLFSWYAAKKYKSKVVIYHGPYYSKNNIKYNLMCYIFDLFFLQRYKKRSTCFLVKSSLARDFLQKKGIINKNIFVSGVGIDLDYYGKIKINKKKQNDTINLMYVGKIEKRRNIHFVLSIYRNLSKKYNVKLTIVGKGEGKYYNTFLKNISFELKMSNIIYYRNLKQSELCLLYEENDYFILPTDYDIFGMVLLESMYFKNVVLTTKNGGSTELIQNGYNGFMINELSNKWEIIIEDLIKNPEKKERIAENAKKTIISNYLWKKRVDIFEEVYEKILIQRKK